MIAAAILAAACSCLTPPLSRADTSHRLADSARAAPADSLKRKGRPLLSKREAVVGGMAVLATIAARSYDQRVNVELQEANFQDAPGLHRTASDLAFLGGPGPFLIGASLVTVGEVTNNHGFVGVGARLTESVALSATITAFAKGFAGRALPGVHTKHSFSFGRGFQDDNGPFVSFPSGHTAAAFAMAESFSVDADRSSPALGRFVRPLAFAMATGVAASRLYNHVHWLSDLPLAAVIGMWSASTVQSRATVKTRTVGDQVLQGVGVTPTRSGFAISWTSR